VTFAVSAVMESLMLKYAVGLSALLLVLVTIADAQSRERKQREPDVRISGQKFTPAELKIRPGHTVVWINEDDRDHSIVASDKSFKSGNLGNGARFEHKFSQAGKHAYQCIYHPREKGTIVVEAESK
jgi:plastocyanin